MGTFSIEITEQVGNFLNELYQEHLKEISNISRELNVSMGCAGDIWYLRGRSRHTQELEDRLIQLHKDGNPPNIMEFE